MAVSITVDQPLGAATVADPLAALRQRLEAAARVLDVEADCVNQDSATATSVLFGRLVDHVHAEVGTRALWLVLTAVSAALPDSESLLAARRARDLRTPGDFGIWLLEAAHEAARSTGTPTAEMDVVQNGVVVDVDFSARYELHTGIQRVVRETVPRWVRRHDLTLIVWTDTGGAMRHLARHEADRVLRWHDRTRVTADDVLVNEIPHRIVVPWNCTVVLPENPPPEHCSALVALSLFSDNEVSLIGYDCIPALSPELIHPGLPERFSRYLETVKHARRVVGISASAMREFRGFTAMLAAQGLPGPHVDTCLLPVQVPTGLGAVPSSSSSPLVVCIGSFEPRKNQLAVLHAAEVLWREGHEFRLTFIGGGGWVSEADDLMSRLEAIGRPVQRNTAISDTELWRTLRSARFSVFVSLHEGFGLPVAESLACGTPVLTTAHGSTGEIAAEGGALVVNPDDDEAVAEQMRRLLTDDALIRDLRSQAADRPVRTWDDYARESWRLLVPTPEPSGDPAR